jgi:hypothetical protein
MNAFVGDCLMPNFKQVKVASLILLGRAGMRNRTCSFDSKIFD